MAIAKGDRLPQATFKQVTAEGMKDVTTGDYFGGRKVVLFGVPGAFTPTCSNNHLPGFVENRDAILAKGVDAIAVVAVNDAFVMKAWANFTGALDKIDFLADGAGAFAKATGLDVDLSAAGMGVRVQRFAMIVNDGVVEAVMTGDKPGQAEVSGAAAVLGAL